MVLRTIERRHRRALRALKARQLAKLQKDEHIRHGDFTHVHKIPDSRFALFVGDARQPQPMYTYDVRLRLK